MGGLTSSEPGHLMQRRHLVLSLGLGWAPQAPAWANTPLTLIVPFAVGGASDVLARQVAPHLARAMDTPVIVENLPGASGTLAAQKVLAAPADGRTLMVVSSSETILPPLLMKTVKFQPQDFRLLVGALSAPLALIGRPGLAPTTLEALLARATDTTQPPLTCGHLGTGSVTHLAAEHFSLLTGAPLTLVPYRGGTPIANDLVGEQLDLTFLALAGPLLPLIQARKMPVYGLASTAARPSQGEPQRLLSSHPKLRGFSHASWLSFAVPKGVPDAVAQQLSGHLNDALQAPELRQLLAQMGVAGAVPATLADAARFYEDQTRSLQALARAIRLQAQ
jgi:tripartite-type tricarboxylate transporter receptor subunit TctC